MMRKQKKIITKNNLISSKVDCHKEVSNEPSGLLELWISDYESNISEDNMDIDDT